MIGQTLPDFSGVQLVAKKDGRTVPTEAGLNYLEEIVTTATGNVYVLMKRSARLPLPPPWLA